MESPTLTIRLHKSESLPQPGDEMQVMGMAGRYLLHIKQVLAVREHPSNGMVFVEVQATRTLLQERKWRS